MIDTVSSEATAILAESRPEGIEAFGSQRVLVIVGPTAVGKTSIAEKTAVALGAEIVSADSMQVYRGMDVGTAKPAPDERSVPYHCLDLVEPGQPFSAALYQRSARLAIADIASRGLLPMVVGGTGLYVRAAIDDWEFPEGEQTDNPVRQRFEEYAERRGPEALYSLLEESDPASAALIHPNNVRRAIRALELVELGESYARQHSGFSERQSIYDSRIVGLNMERDLLYRRIDARVDGMIEHGLLGEVERLLEAGFEDALTAAQAIGYKELVPVVKGTADLQEAAAAIKQATRRYAKRQLTWFMADPRTRWVDVTDMSTDDAASAVVAALD